MEILDIGTQDNIEPIKTKTIINELDRDVVVDNEKQQYKLEKFVFEVIRYMRTGRLS